MATPSSTTYNKTTYKVIHRRLFMMLLSVSRRPKKTFVLVCAHYNKQDETRIFNHLKGVNLKLIRVHDLDFSSTKLMATAVVVNFFLENCYHSFREATLLYKEIRRDIYVIK